MLSLNNITKQFGAGKRSSRILGYGSATDRPVGVPHNPMVMGTVWQALIGVCLDYPSFRSRRLVPVACQNDIDTDRDLSIEFETEPYHS